VLADHTHPSCKPRFSLELLKSRKNSTIQKINKIEISPELKSMRKSIFRSSQNPWDWSRTQIQKLGNCSILQALMNWTAAASQCIIACNSSCSTSINCTQTWSSMILDLENFDHNIFATGSWSTNNTPDHMLLPHLVWNLQFGGTMPCI
jgi:hypothetical protein